jgi:hypothetical protein
MAVRISKLKKDEETMIVSQAERIIKKFGGVPNLQAALSAIGCPRSKSIIYRWTYTRENGGTNGLIPSAVLFDIVVAGRKLGIELSSEDLDIRPTVKVFTARERSSERLRDKEIERQRKKRNELK